MTLSEQLSAILIKKRVRSPKQLKREDSNAVNCEAAKKFTAKNRTAGWGFTDEVIDATVIDTLTPVQYVGAALRKPKGKSTPSSKTTAPKAVHLPKDTWKDLKAALDKTRQAQVALDAATGCTVREELLAAESFFIRPFLCGVIFVGRGLGQSNFKNITRGSRKSIRVCTQTPRGIL